MKEPRIDCPNPECKFNFERRILECPNCKNIAIKKLYKYMPYNEHTLAILNNNQIWAPKASTLNDPFEFTFSLSDDYDQKSYIEALEYLNNKGVICLSEINNNILMWAHYANKHKGVCIEFDRNEDNELGNKDVCVPVIYDKDNRIPEFTFIDFKADKAFSIIVTQKAVDWEYEKEWRIISQKGDSLSIFPVKITGIIFGCNMEKIHKVAISNILGRDMKYMKAKKQKKMYGLDIIPIDFNIL